MLLKNRRQILALARKYGANNVRIFGSVARGEAHSGSDIDFLVDLEPGRSLFDLGGFLYELQSLLGIAVDVVTEKGLRQRFRDRVLKEAIPL
ncbi:predicted nucleotidyltransferases [Longilinea arvoryzae]|uniref:Predicted nucleotidyltransferases n=1 Tax=Longilinea arvoryzae TaxID=360412 RepID=A0A0S7BCB1_9CHLR|nr:nucleotidyltransferase family protein [Longilinea arvoryzae]GAP12825.1 predicted nucleotidyltransferases [Longilinea arvoryzae]